MSKSGLMTENCRAGPCQQVTVLGFSWKLGGLADYGLCVYWVFLEPEPWQEFPDASCSPGASKPSWKEELCQVWLSRQKAQPQSLGGGPRASLGFPFQQLPLRDVNLELKNLYKGSQ